MLINNNKTRALGLYSDIQKYHAGNDNIMG